MGFSLVKKEKINSEQDNYSRK